MLALVLVALIVRKLEVRDLITAAFRARHNVVERDILHSWNRLTTDATDTTMRVDQLPHEPTSRVTTLTMLISLAHQTSRRPTAASMAWM